VICNRRMAINSANRSSESCFGTFLNVRRRRASIRSGYSPVRCIGGHDQRSDPHFPVLAVGAKPLRRLGIAPDASFDWTFRASRKDRLSAVRDDPQPCSGGKPPTTPFLIVERLRERQAKARSASAAVTASKKARRNSSRPWRAARPLSALAACHAGPAPAQWRQAQSARH